MNIQLFTEDDDRAVSPVIGVILMVAITVILAAVIGAFVLNLGSNVESNVQAGANVQYDSSNDKISVVYSSNQNAEYLDVSVGSNSHFLCDVGSKVTYGTSSSESGYSGNVASSGSGCTGGGSYITSNGDTITAGTQISTVVTAVKGDQSTVIVDKSGQV